MSNKKDVKRDVREEMLTNEEELGTLYIDPKYKEEGYVYRIADADKPGRIAQLTRFGYEVVEDPNFKVGVNTNSTLGAAVTVSLGIHKDRVGILMRIPQERYDIRQKMKAKKADEQLASTGHSDIPTAYGNITIGNNTTKF